MSRTAFARIAVALALSTAGLVCQIAPANATVPAASGLVPVAAGDGFACVTTQAGGVDCWGANDHGQLGDGSGVAQSSAVAVAGLTGVVAIGAGGSHACALTSAGVVDCWGLNLDGEIGNGTLSDAFEPVSVLSNAVAIAVGSAHTCALTNVGGVKCWGSNLDGEVGDGTTTTRLTPVDVSGTTSGVIAITAGGAHSCALTMAGGVKCWGRNDRGQLGDGTTTNRVTPVFAGGFTAGPIGEVAAGGAHTCVLSNDGGEVVCWGANDSGQLGDNSTTDSLTPTEAIASGAAAVSAGASQTCALMTSGALQCWGAGGLVGDGTAVQRDAPVAVVGLSSEVASVAAGGDVTCAVTNTGAPSAETKCWGTGSAVGDPNVASTPDVPVPTEVLAAPSPIYWKIAPGETHTCALMLTLDVKCWGDNTNGELGDGTTTSRSVPEDVTGLIDIDSVSAGADSSCAVNIEDAAACWGDNSSGELGDGTNTSRSTAVDVSGLTSGVTEISMGTDSSLVPGYRHACAVVSGAAECWGDNTWGELGNSSRVNSNVPVAVTGLSAGVTAVAAGGAFSCAIVNGGAKCWGLDTVGQLGSTSGTCAPLLCSPSPQDVTGLTSGVSQIAVGADHACALTTTGVVKCWGDNAYGQLGDTTTTNRSTPVTVFTFEAGGGASIALGENHSCAVTVDGFDVCWGAGSSGQLGDGHGTDESTVTYPFLSPIRTVSGIGAGGDTSCATTSDGESHCWGSNSSGQVGDGTTTNQLEPVPVLGDAPATQQIDPSPPPIVVGTPANGSVSLAWAMPSDIGEIAPTDYQITAYNSTGGAPTGVTGATTRTVGSNDPAFTFTGLTNGVGYRFTVESLWFGPSFPSGPSPLSSILVPRTLPSAPTAVAAAAGNRQAVVHWTAPATNGGLAITNYRVSVFNSTGGAATGVTGATARLVGSAATTLTFTGLTDNTAYRFHVEAFTGAGYGPASTLSASVTPFVTLQTAAGSGQSCAILPSTGVQCWGQNNAGQVGDGTTLTRLTPVNVSTLASGVTAIADGASHSCARLSTGAVKCWGLNSSGQLGDGTTTNRLTPVAVSGLTSGVTAIAAGGSHTCALLTAGTVKCWGLNSSGQLGDGTTTNRHTPVAVTGLTGVTAIAAGGSYTCARLSTGAVKCWGLNSSGQLGDGTTTLRKTPVAVSGLVSGVTAITAGTSHTCARLSTGAVKCWGLNSSGQLGDGTTTNRLTPVAVSGMTTATAVSAGAAHTCALLTTATVKCWGLNSSGQLGDGTTVLRKTPVAVTGLTTVASIALGANHTTARLTTGAPRTWGANANGQLGSGTTTNRSTAGTVVGLT